MGARGKGSGGSRDTSLSNACGLILSHPSAFKGLATPFSIVQAEDFCVVSTMTVFFLGSNLVSSCHACVPS